MTAERMTGVFGLSARWAARALIASLALNFLLIGVAVGVGLNAGKSWRGGQTAFVARQIADLAGSDALSSLAETENAERAERRATRRGQWAEVAGVLSRTPYDPAALTALFATMRATREAAWTMRHATLAAAIEGLSDDERAELAARIVKRNEEREKKRK